MQIRDAILAAASHIERNPGRFKFDEIAVPERDAHECGAPGCAIGWVAHFTGLEFPRTGGGLCPHHKPQIMRVHDDSNVCSRVFGCGHDELYSRLDALDIGWMHAASACARALRLYADKYHLAPAPILPDWNAMAAVQSVGADVPDQVFTP